VPAAGSESCTTSGPTTQTLVGAHWHHLPSFEVLELLESDPQRELDVFRVQHRRHHLGPNALVPERGKNPLVRFFCSS